MKRDLQIGTVSIRLASDILIAIQCGNAQPTESSVTHGVGVLDCIRKFSERAPENTPVSFVPLWFLFLFPPELLP